MIHLLKGDITTLDVDCIVNAANEKLMPGGGVCGAIHQAAGEGLEKDWIKSANDRGLDGAMLVKTAKDLISKYDK